MHSLCARTIMGASIPESCSDPIPGKQNHGPLLLLLVSHEQNESTALRPDCYIKGSFQDAYVSSANGTSSARRNLGRTIIQTTRRIVAPLFSCFLLSYSRSLAGQGARLTYCGAPLPTTAQQRNLMMTLSIRYLQWLSYWARTRSPAKRCEVPSMFA